MIWVILTALAAVCGAAKLDTNFLPSISARTAGGSAGALLAPFDGSQGLPTGSYTNDAQGVVVDAVKPGTRTSGLEPTGLGGPRTSYGSKDSKVGDAAFGVFGSISPGLTRIAPGFGSFIESNEPQADKESGNSLKLTSDVGFDSYSYGFETDNGISVGENGEAAGGVKAQGEYSYKGDHGKKYSVSYTADKGGNKHQGQHLPTPPPNEILISLEKNAKEAAAGHVDDGSYTAQKHNDEGDYTSNGAGYNNRRPTIGGGDATSSGSYVSQSGQRPTSGLLVGSYTPGSVGSFSTQGHSAQGFGQVSGNKQSNFGINKDQSGSQGITVAGGSSAIEGQFGQAGSKGNSIVSHDELSSQTGSSQSRFGVQTSKSEGSHAHAHASAGSPVRSPSIHNGASAFSSAVAKGSGSASAFASSAPLGFGLKNEYLPPSNSFGSAGQHTHGSISGSDSSAGASFPAPSTATASASTSGSQTLGSQTHSHSNLPSSGSASGSASGNQHSYGHLNQQQAVPSRLGEVQQATFASNTQKPFISQQQGSDDSYHYKQPSKPFITPATVATGQYQGTSSSNYNGITQASISPFPSGSSSSSSQFASQSSQFGSKPSTQFGQTSQPTSTQFGSTETHSGHKVQGQTQFAQSGLQAPTQFGSTETHSGHQTQSQTQFGQSLTSQTSDSSKSSTQQYHGTIYQYNKPATTLSGNKVQGHTQFGQSGQQTSTQFGSTETHSGHKVQGQAQLVQSGLQVPTQSGSTETHFGHQTSQTSDSSHSPTQQYHGTIYQYKKPATTLPAQGHKDTSGFAQATATSGKPGQIETDSRFGTQQTGSKVQTSQFGQKPIVSSQVSGSNYQFGSSGSQFVQKPVTTQGSIISSNTNTQIQSQTSSVQKQTTQGTSFTQFGKKPVVSTTQTGTQLGSPSSQFGQNSQFTFGSGSVSTTAKPFGSSYQQTQFGSKPATTQGSSYTYTQTQTSQFGKKPVVSTTQTGTQFGSGSQFSQNSQFGSSGSKFGQNSQSTFGSDSQFGQNSQSTVGAGLVSSTVKPEFGSSYQQTQLGSKPSTTQGSSFTYTQSQTSQFGKKPVVSTTQTGTQFGSGSQFGQNSQFGSSGSQFGQNSQSTFGSGSVSTTTKPIGSSYQQTGSQYGQNVQSSSGVGSVSTTVKPAFGSSYQQTQFGSKPSTTQGSSFTYTQSQSSQFGKKPVVSTTQTGTQFGSGSQFGQNSQSTFGSGSVSTTAKPIGSSYQQTGSQFGQNVQSSSGAGSVSTTVKPAFGSSYLQTQFGSKPTTSQGSSFTYTESQTSQFGKKPVVSTTQTGTQFGSGSQFGQNSQSTFGSGSVSTTAKPIGSSYQQTGSQFGQNVQSSSGAGSVSTTVKPAFGSSYLQTQFGSKPTTSQGSSFTYTESQTSQFGKKPVVSTTQTGTQFGSGSQFGQNSQFGLSGSQFGQNSQSTFGSGSVSTTAKPIGSSYQQTGSQFGQNVQSSSGAGSVSTTVKPAFGSSYQQTQFSSKPTTSKGSSFTYTESQTSQFGKKPVVSTTQTGTQFGSGSQFGQNSQFGLSGSQFGQNSQSTFGSGSVSTTAKPIQQTGSQFSQNVQSSSGVGSVSTTVKPAFGSSYQQTQFGSKPTTSQGSSFTYTESQTSQFGKKPVVGTTQTGTQFGSGSQFGQNSQFGLSGTQFGQNSQSTFGSGSVSTTAKPIGSSYQQTQFGSKPSTTQGSSFTYTQTQTSQFGKKPVDSKTQTGTQFGSGSQFGQNSQFGSSGSQFGQNSQSTFGSGSVSTTAKPIGSSYQQTGSQFGQNVQSSSGVGSVSTTVKPAFGSSYQQTQFGSKPSTSQGSSFTYTQSQTSQFGKKPVVSTTQTGTQFGSGSQFGQNSQSTVGAGLVSSTVKPAFGSSYQQTQFGSKPSTTQGSSFTYTQSQTSQFGKKPVVSTTQTGTQFGSGSQFGQNSQSTVGAGLVSSTVKPAFGSSYQQTQFGSKPTTTQGSSFTYTQGQTSQFGKKPVVSTTQTGTQFGSGSQFGQNSQSTFGSGSVSTTTKPIGSSYQQTGSQFGQNVQSSSGVGSVSTTVKPAFGSSYQQTQFGSKPSTSQGSSFTYTQSQTSQFGKKPIVSTTQTGTQFGSGSLFGQNSQSTVGAGLVSSTVKPAFGSSYQQTQFGSKPSTTQGSSFTYTQSQTSQFGKKPVVSTTQTGTQFGSGSQFGQNSQSTVGAGLVSSTVKPAFGSSYQQTQFGSKPTTTQGSSFTYTQGQTSQFGKKPVVSTTQTGTQFGSGSQFGQNSQSTVGAGLVSSTVKPAFGSSYQQTQFGSKPTTTQGSSFTYTQSQTSQLGKKPVVSTTQTGTQLGSGFQFGQNSQSTQDSAIALTTSKPVVGIKPVYQQAQFGSSGSQFGQNSQLSQGFGSVSTTAKPAFGQTSFGSSSQISQFGSSGSQLVQKPQSATQGSSYSSGLGSAGEAVQKTQFGVAGSSSSGTGNKVSGSSSGSGSSFQQTQFAGSSGSQIGQTTQYGIKPFGSAQATQGSTQFGSTPSRFGEPSETILPISTISQVVEPTQFGQKPFQTPFGSSTTHFGQKPQAHAFASSSGSNVVPFSSTQTGQVSKYETSKFGVQNQGVVSTTQKPIGSVSSQTNYQQYQYTQSSEKSGSQSQFGQGSQSNVGSGQISQTTFGQKPFGSSQGSAFQIGGQSIGDQPSQGTVQTTSVTGYNYQKPQSVFTTQYGSQSNGAQDQKVQQSQTNFNSAVSTVQTPINGQTFKPFGVPSTQGTFQQSQSTVSSSQFGAQAVKPTDFTGPVIQTSYNKFSGKPFQPASTVSSQGSKVQSQSSAVSTSLFGLKPTPSTELAHFSGKPEYSILPSHEVALNPNVFSSTQTPSRVGSNGGLVVSSGQIPIVPVPGYELVINEGTSTNQGLSHSLVGLGEQFGGPRDPPRFDDKTGYHY